jgi:hypothetical protein
MRTIKDITDRVRAEYLEMPGLRLKADQVARLCGIERMVCEIVLDTLLDTKFLCVKSDGHYARLTEGRCSHHQSAPNSRQTFEVIPPIVPGAAR